MNAGRAGAWQAFSAGSRPAGYVHPLAIRVLAEVGIEVRGARSKPLSEFRGQPFDLVVTVCSSAAEECPVWLGQGRRVHQEYPDPAKVEGDEAQVLAAFRSVRDAMLRDIPACCSRWPEAAMASSSSRPRIAAALLLGLLLAGPAAAPAGGAPARLAGAAHPLAGGSFAGGDPGAPGPGMAGWAANRPAGAGLRRRAAVPVLPGRRPGAPVLQPPAGPGHGPALSARPVPLAARHGAARSVRGRPGAAAAVPGGIGLWPDPRLRGAVRGDWRAAPAAGSGVALAAGGFRRGGRRSAPARRRAL